MLAIAEKGGLERLVDRGVINELSCQDLTYDVINGSDVSPIIEVLDGMADKLCDLLEDRDRREGKSDNPPEIPEEG